MGNKKYTYIKRNNFYIKNNYESLKFFIKYIHVGREVPKAANHQFIRYFFNKTFSFLIFFFYVSGLFSFFTKKEKLEENFVCRRIGKGNWPNIITIKKEKGKYWVYKKVHSKKEYKKENKFYETYKNNKSKIKLPKHYFLKEGVIKIEFIKYKNFEKIIKQGLYSEKELYKIFKILVEEIINLYKDKKGKYFIQGDFGLQNLFVNKKDKKIMLIDYSDCFKGSFYYDIYVLHSQLSKFLSEKKLQQIICEVLKKNKLKKINLYKQNKLSCEIKSKKLS